jgi:hypothetical protein
MLPSSRHTFCEAARMAREMDAGFRLADELKYTRIVLASDGDYVVEVCDAN